jgi:hypothetical protein
MITFDFINTAANVTIFLLFLRFLQSHFVKSGSALDSALGFIFH